MSSTTEYEWALCLFRCAGVETKRLVVTILIDGAPGQFWQIGPNLCQAKATLRILIRHIAHAVLVMCDASLAHMPRVSRSPVSQCRAPRRSLRAAPIDRRSLLATPTAMSSTTPTKAEIAECKKNFLKECKADKLMSSFPEKLELISYLLMKEPTKIMPALDGVQTGNLPGMSAKSPRPSNAGCSDEAAHWDSMPRASRLPTSWTWSFLMSMVPQGVLTPAVVDLMESADKQVSRKCLTYTTGVLDGTPFHACMSEKVICSRTLRRRAELLGADRLRDLLANALNRNTGVVTWANSVYTMVELPTQPGIFTTVRHISGVEAIVGRTGSLGELEPWSGSLGALGCVAAQAMDVSSFAGQV